MKRHLFNRLCLIASTGTSMFFLHAQPLMACPTCKNALHDGTALGYAISVLFMMSMPFAIMCFWVVTIMRLRAKMLKAAALQADV